MNSEIKTLRISVLTLITGVIIVVGIYIYKFSGSSLSSDPSDWGVLGDYVGGVLNPFISLITLFYLLKTYFSQKKELARSEKAAQEQHEISQRNAQEQREISQKIAQEQHEISQKTAKINSISTLISASYEKIALYRGEMGGVTGAMNAPRGGLSFTAMDGNEYTSDSAQKQYRLRMANKIDEELVKIDKYIKDIESLSV